jgi:hypothetical protein
MLGARLLGTETRIKPVATRQMKAKLSDNWCFLREWPVNCAGEVGMNGPGLETF